MTIKLELTLNQLEIILDGLELELQRWDTYLHKDIYEKQEYEETKAIMDKLDQILLKEKELLK